MRHDFGNFEYMKIAVDMDEVLADPLKKFIQLYHLVALPFSSVSKEGK